MKNTTVPLVGGYYADEARSWSAQDCVNWLPTQAEKQGTRTPGMLKTPPGLREFTLTPAHPLTLTGHLAVTLVGVAVSYQYAVTGGLPAITVGISSGALPTGLTISSSGLVTGTTTTDGAFSWTVEATDSELTTVLLPDSTSLYTPATFDPTKTAATLTNGNRDFPMSAGSNGGRANTRKASGKWYLEMNTLASYGGAMEIIVWTRDDTLDMGFNNSGPDVINIAGDGSYYLAGSYVSSGGPAFGTAGDVTGIAFDVATNNVWFRNASGWIGGGDPALGTTPFATLTATTALTTVGVAMNTGTPAPAMEINCGQDSFAYAIPSGFSPLSTP